MSTAPVSCQKPQVLAGEPVKEPRLQTCTACSYPVDCHDGIVCSTCMKSVCNVCSAAGQCPKCRYDLPDDRKVDFGDTCAVQKGTEQNIRAGTAKLLNAGARRVRVLADHNIKPKFIQKVIRQETAR